MVKPELVNGLWIGKLGEIQILSIHSFLKNGHPYRLWMYPPYPKNIPKEDFIYGLL